MDAYVAAGGKSPPGVCAVTSQSRVASKARDEAEESERSAKILWEDAAATAQKQVSPNPNPHPQPSTPSLTLNPNAYPQH